VSSPAISKAVVSSNAPDQGRSIQVANDNFVPAWSCRNDDNSLLPSLPTHSPHSPNSSSESQSQSAIWEILRSPRKTPTRLAGPFSGQIEEPFKDSRVLLGRYCHLYQIYNPHSPVSLSPPPPPQAFCVNNATNAYLPSRFYDTDLRAES